MTASLLVPDPSSGAEHSRSVGVPLCSTGAERADPRRQVRVKSAASMPQYAILGCKGGEVLSERWRGAGIYSLAAVSMGMMSIDTSQVATALPVIQESAGASLSDVGWLVSCYSAGFLLFLPVAARIAERYGVRRSFLTSLAFFGAGSSVVGCFDEIHVMLPFRFLQGVGSAGFTPAATGMLMSYLGDRRDAAMATVGSAIPLGSIIGPMTSHFLTVVISWRAIFWVHLPICILLALVTVAIVPADAPVVRRRHLAVFGQGFVPLAFVVAGVLGATAAARIALTTDSGAAILITAGSILVVALIVFVRRIREAHDPVVEPRFLIGANFAAVNAVNIAYGGVIIGLISITPAYLARYYDLEPGAGATVLVIYGVTAFVIGVAGGSMIRRTGHRRPLQIGAVAIAIAVWMLAGHHPSGHDSAWWFNLSAAVLGAGMGIVSGPSRNAALALEPHRSASLAAVRTVCYQAGLLFTVTVGSSLDGYGSSEAGLLPEFITALSIAMAVGIVVIRRVPENRGAL